MDSLIKTTHGKPDPDEKNEDRAAWGQAAVKKFQKLTGSDDDTALQDLLCDLMHFADATNQNFDRILDNARSHYAEETSAD